MQLDEALAVMGQCVQELDTFVTCPTLPELGLPVDTVVQALETIHAYALTGDNEDVDTPA